MVRTMILLAGILIATVPVADAQRLRERLAERMAARGAEAPAAGMVEHAYGTAPSRSSISGRRKARHAPRH